MRDKVGDPKLQAEAVELLRRTDVPVSVDFVAHHLGMAWSTARALLFKLALDGKIVARKTSKAWIFSASE